MSSFPPTTRLGFTLFELIIVISLLAILGTSGVAYYRNTARQAELKSSATGLISHLREARANAQTGENQLFWGVHLVNGANDYYEIFSSPSTYANANTANTTTVYLLSTVAFTDPAESSNKDIIFSRINATTTPTTVILTVEGVNQTITITSNGTVY